MNHEEYISEGYALLEQGLSLGEPISTKSKLYSNLQPDAINIYHKNKGAKVGEDCACPTCGKHFIKKSYQQAFCRKRGKGKKEGKGNLCKDTYHNSVSEKRRFRASLFR